MNRALRTASGLVLAPVLLALATPAEGQIVNTLRGWGDVEPGWSGEIEGQIALAEGNSEYFQLLLGGAAQLNAGRHRWRVLGSETLTWANDRKVSENLLLHLRHNYRVRPWLSSLIFTQTQYNPFQRLASRVLFGGGARFDIVREETWEGALGASYMLEIEDLTDDDAGSETEHRQSYFASLVGNPMPNLRLDLSGFWQPLLADFSDSRAYGAGSARVDVVGGLDLLVSVGVQHDSNPPAGVEETDLTLRSGLVLEF